MGQRTMSQTILVLSWSHKVSLFDDVETVQHTHSPSIPQKFHTWQQDGSHGVGTCQGVCISRQIIWMMWFYEQVGWERCFLWTSFHYSFFESWQNAFFAPLVILIKYCGPKDNNSECIWLSILQEQQNFLSFTCICYFPSHSNFSFLCIVLNSVSSICLSHTTLRMFA